MVDNRKQENLVRSDVSSDTSFVSKPLTPSASGHTFNLPLMPEDSQGAHFIQKGNYIIRGCGRRFEVEEVALVDVQIPEEEIDAEILANKIDVADNEVGDSNTIVEQLEGPAFSGEKELKVILKLLKEEEEDLLERQEEEQKDDLEAKEFLAEMEMLAKEELLAPVEETEGSVQQAELEALPRLKAFDDFLTQDPANFMFWPDIGHLEVEMNDIFTGPITVSILELDSEGYLEAFIGQNGHVSVHESEEAYAADLPQPVEGATSSITYQIQDTFGQIAEAQIIVTWVML